MFEISWSELLILAIVTLIFVGPKDLPVFLRTIGKYAGSMKRQASEIRAQFDAAMREVELDAMKKEVDSMQSAVNAEVMGAKAALNEASQAAAIAPERPNPLVPGSSFPTPYQTPVPAPSPEPVAHVSQPSVSPAPLPALSASPVLPSSEANIAGLHLSDPVKTET